MKKQFHISGMTCSACSSHVEKSVNKLEGMSQASVNLLTETMQADYDEEKLNPGDIIAAVEKAGYGAVLKEEHTQGGSTGEQSNRQQGRETVTRQADAEARQMRLRLIVSVVFLIPLMYVAMYHMFSDWFGLPIPQMVMEMFHGNSNAMNFALTQFLLTLPILYVNRKFFTVGFKTLSRLSPNMDSLIALGASAAMVYGVFAMYRISYGLGRGNPALVEQYSHDLYFESAGTILTLITVGKYLESRSKGKTSEAITKLMDLSPKTAIVLQPDGSEVQIPTEQLKAGDVFLVKPGSLVPADGIVLEGTSSINEAAITGESIPVEKSAGDEVISATVNKAGFLKCEAKRVGEDTTLSQIIRLVEEAGASKAPIAKMADKIAGIFVPIVIAIAIITCVIWLISGASAEFAISVAIAVLVISCPCALGLATPVAIMVGTGVGAKNGILIKSGEALQEARGIDTVVMDKTGTITEGNLKVMEIYQTQGGISEEQFLLTAAAIEKKSEHPLSEAVVEAAAKYQKPLPEVIDFKAVFGRGVTGVVKEGGRSYYIGNKAYMQEQGVTLSAEELVRIDAMAEKGMTPLLAAEEGKLLGAIGVADQIKDTSKEAIVALKKLGIRVIMLTGDNKRTAKAVQEKLGIEEVIADVLPQDKERNISELRNQGRRVAMIGDGINDAPALAAADVGIAIGAGTDVAIESADIILMKGDLRDAVTAIRLSRAVIRNIKENLFWAFFYNSIGIPLAAGVLYPAFGMKLNPMFGAAAMSLSSIFVVGNALRLKAFKAGFAKKKEEKKEEMSMKIVITVEGMSCGHCTARVQKALEEIDGVEAVMMSLEDKTAEVTLKKEVADEALKAAIEDAGYEAVKFCRG